MLIDNIANTSEKIYSNISILKDKIKKGGTDGTNICNEITNVFTKSDNFNKNKLLDFKNNVNSKYFKDQVITCLRKHASDIDNIDRLKETICKNNMYNIIKNVYKLPENINSISNMLFLINIALFSIFSINFGIIIIHLMKNYDITTLIIFSILIFILILLAFLSM
tara:strand:+ start:1012 stop:1509 length:498 start_codon:yes stop_codon:yes gene_type:complete